jgi:dTDP-glucose 4,6-dehydratase
VTNCSNNYGPNQHPEKLIPVVIQSLLQGKTVPIYGDGLQVRDWLFVRDHAEALWQVLTQGRDGELYCVGARNEWPNLRLTEQICELIDEMAPERGKKSKRLIRLVDDRPGHDRRYALDPTKIERELGWRPERTFERGLRETVRWYVDNQDWVKRVLSG